MLILVLCKMFIKFSTNSTSWILTPARWGSLDSNKSAIPSFLLFLFLSFPFLPSTFLHSLPSLPSSCCAGWALDTISPAPDAVEHLWTRTARLDPNTCQRECQRRCQNMHQIECQMECQMECWNRCQIECQSICRTERQVEWQNRYDMPYIICALPNDMSETIQKLCKNRVSREGSLKESNFKHTCWKQLLQGIALFFVLNCERQVYNRNWMGFAAWLCLPRTCLHYDRE